MYKAIGEDSWRDGVFSHAAPWQDYQASLTQFEDGSLGSGLKDVRRYRRGPAGEDTRGRYRVKPMSGAFRDGSLGHTVLQAFAPREMRGLGHAYRDGVLGADPISNAACSTLQPCLDSLTIPHTGAGEAMDVSMKVPFNQLMAVAVVGLTVAVAHLYMKR